MRNGSKLFMIENGTVNMESTLKFIYVDIKTLT